ncbi:hypothetical protein HPB48_015769 [Haemaphysalis longicornis]|uniref:Uncharacterized protein n=1 Tax=Haemaphysalis longicornis TaxID=44386 RepID=A0A9J6FQ17_HAELO|nr:hypothetical protein HPB48_015769 [Haemaphysalis longicornis]
MQPSGAPARGSPSRERWARPGSPGRGGRRQGSPGRGSRVHYSQGRRSPSRHSLGRGSPSRYSRARRGARPRSRPPTPPREPRPLPPPPPMDENTRIIRQIMAKKMDEWERMVSSKREDVRDNSFKNFRKLVDEEVDMANKIHSERRLKELMEQKLEYFDRLVSATDAMMRRHAESKFEEIGEKEMALAKSVGPSRVREEAEAKTKLAEERRQKEKYDEAKKAAQEEKRKSKEKMTQAQFYGYPPWGHVLDYPRMPGAISGMMTGFPYTGAMQGVMPFEAQPSSSYTNYMTPNQAIFPSEDFAWLSMGVGGLNSDFIPPSFDYWPSFASDVRRVNVVPVTKSQGSEAASEIDQKMKLLTHLEAARAVLQNHPIESSASMAEEIRKRLKKINRLQMKLIDDVLGYNPDLMTEIMSELMPTESERNRFYGLGSGSSGRSVEMDLSASERRAFRRERMPRPLDDYCIGTYCLPPQELPPHTHYHKFHGFYATNAPHYHKLPPPLHPADAVFDMPAVFPAPTYSFFELDHYRGHEHLPHNIDLMGYEVEGPDVGEGGCSLKDPYDDGHPRVLTPNKKPAFLSHTTIIINRPEQAVNTDAVAQTSRQVLVQQVQPSPVAATPVPVEQLIVQPMQQALMAAVPAPAQQTVVGKVAAAPLEQTRATLLSAPERAQQVPVTPTAFADEDFVRQCEDNLARIAESFENVLHSLSTVSFGRPRGRRKQGRRRFDEDYYDDYDSHDEGDDYGDYDQSPPSDYRENASKSIPSERRRHHTRDKDGPSFWNWLRQGSSNLRDRAPILLNHNDAQLVQAADQIRELTRKITEASAEVIAARQAVQQPGLQGQQAAQPLMTAEAKLWRLIDLETQLANAISRYRLLNTSSDQSCRASLVEAEDKIRRLIQAETQLAGDIAGYRQTSQQRAGPTVEVTPDETASTTSTSSSTSSPTSGT